MSLRPRKQMKKSGGRWIQQAIKKPGSLTDYVRDKYGDEGFDHKGRIKMSILRDLARPQNNVRKKTRSRARLALSLREMSEKK